MRRTGFGRPASYTRASRDTLPNIHTEPSQGGAVIVPWSHARGTNLRPLSTEQAAVWWGGAPCNTALSNRDGCLSRNGCMRLRVRMLL